MLQGIHLSQPLHESPSKWIGKSTWNSDLYRIKSIPSNQAAASHLECVCSYSHSWLPWNCWIEIPQILPTPLFLNHSPGYYNCLTKSVMIVDFDNSYWEQLAMISMKRLFLRASYSTIFYDILKGDWESVLKNSGL